MPSLALVAWASVLINFCVTIAVMLGLAWCVMFFADLNTMSPAQRMMRERRRHAQQTARAMRRMSAIRRETARRMDRAERRWRP
jgi:hypothetical protein